MNDATELDARGATRILEEVSTMAKKDDGHMDVKKGKERDR